MSGKGETLLAVFDDSSGLTDAARALLEKGHAGIEALSPAPVPELEELLPPRSSSVRWFTLCGCIAGGVLGFAFQIMTVVQWPIMVGGKPIVSLPAFVVIAFEMTILFGAIATLVGLMLNARLPQIGKDCYHAGCSQSDYALLVECDPAERESIVALLREAGAGEVQTTGPKSVLFGAD